MRLLHKNKDSQRGQTIIETVLMLLILLIIFFMIAEFARAWYLKNSLNNAARVGVRVAVVTPNLVGISNTCSQAGLYNPIEAACSASGVPDNTKVKLDIEDTDADGFLSTGDKVTVFLSANFVSVVPNLFPFITNSVVSQASMRYE
jgi:Flp pilus assembly protein TadG